MQAHSLSHNSHNLRPRRKNPLYGMHNLAFLYRNAVKLNHRLIYSISERNPTKHYRHLSTYCAFKIVNKIFSGVPKIFLLCFNYAELSHYALNMLVLFYNWMLFRALIWVSKCSIRVYCYCGDCFIRVYQFYLY